MAVAETARLIASLELDSRKFMAGADKALGKLNKLGVRSTAIGTAIGTSMSRLAEVGVRKVFGQLTGGLNSLAELEDATTSVDGAIKQLGLTGQVTSGQVATWANEIEANVQAAFDDKAIAQSATTLLRYGKVAPQNLRPAMQVMTDLAAKTGSVEGAATLLAKALADPEKAAGKLARSGVVLTKQQQEQIKAMVKAGKTAEAQAFLLDVLTKTTKGAAEAMHGPFRDSQLIFADVVEDAQRALAIGFIPVLQEVRRELSEALAKPETLNRIKEFGQGLAGGFREFVGFIKTVPWGQIATAAGAVVDFGKGLANAFMALPPEAKQMMIGLAALNKLSGGAVIKIGVDLAQGALGGLLNQFIGKGSPANPMFVVPMGKGLGSVPTPAVPGIVSAGGTGVSALGKVFLVGEAIGLVLAVKAVADSVTANGVAQAKDIGTVLTESLKTATPAEMKIKLDAINTGIARLKADPIAAALVTGPIIAELEAQRAAVVAAISGQPKAPQGMSPDERQALADQRAKLDKLADGAERNRIATITKIEALRTTATRLSAAEKAALDRVRERAEANRIATTTNTAATRTGDASIVAAIRGIQRPIISVSVTGNVIRTTYQTGTTLTRSIRPGILALT